MYKRITIVDIARETNLSVSTVSKALMDAADISEKTKILIRNKADEMGYIPNSNAASLRSGSSKIIGVLCDSLINPFYNTVIYQLEILLSKKNYTISIYRSNRFDNEIYNKIISRNPDGLISFLTPEAEVEAVLKRHSFPVVICGRKSESISSVYFDDEKIGRLAANYFVEKKCRNVMYLGETDTLTISKLRCKGFVDEISTNQIVHGEYFKDSKKSFVSLLTDIDMNEFLHCDGIFCFNDVMAFETMKYLTKIGKTDIIVIGVDNIHADIVLPFPFISVGVDKERLAKKTINLLLDKINQDKELKYYVEEVQLYYSY